MKKLLLILIFSAFFFGVSAQKDFWTLDGNADIDKSHFLGTTDCMPLIFKTNNEERMRLLPDKSFWGIGLDTPKASLHLHYQVDARPCDNQSVFNFTKNLLQFTTSETGYGENDGLSVYYHFRTNSFHFKQYHQGNFFLEGPGGGLMIAPGGNIGMGTQNPLAKLDVNGLFKAKSATVTGNTYLNGNVGIGTNIPKQKLHIVDGNILISKTSSKDMAAPLSPNGSIFFGADINDQFPSGKWGIEYLNGEDGVYGLNFWRPWNPGGGGYFNYGLFLTDDGKMGVGKKDPQTKLDVNGSFKAASANITGALSATSATINGALSATSASIAGILKTKEVQVTLAGWPDYVFDKDYKLPTLSEVEQFIAENNHLPNVPSAAEVEANGIQLGEMNAILIRKVEELTLYILDLQKQIDELKNSKP